MRRLPRFTILASLLFSAPIGAAPRGESALPAVESTVDGTQRASIVASVDPALLAAPAPISAPLIFAHGNLGIPRVITWSNTAGTSGIAWGTTAAITAANSYVSYNATDMLFNVPTGTGILFRENEVTHVSIAATGAVLIDGTDDVVQLTVQGFSTQTTLPFVVENSAGTDQFTVSNAGNVVALGSITLTGNLIGTGNVSITPANGSDTRTTGNLLVLGNNDEVQLTVQGISAQTTLPFVVENNIGTDQFTVSNVGDAIATGDLRANGGDLRISDGTNVWQFTSGATFNIYEPGLVGTVQFSDAGTTVNIVASGQVTSTTYNVNDGNIVMNETGTDVLQVLAQGGVIVDGSTNVVQLTVQGFSTQTTLPFVVENSAGVDQFTVSNSGEILGGLGSGNAALVFAGGTLNVNTTAVGNIGAGEDDLITYSLPASSLIATGRGVRVHAYGSFANNANAKTLTCYAGTQAVNTHAPTVSVAGELWTVDWTFHRTALSAQDWKSEYRGNTGAAAVFDFDPEMGTATQTETGAIVIKCTGTGVADNDIVMDGQIVKAL